MTIVDPDSEAPHALPVWTNSARHGKYNRISAGAVVFADTGVLKSVGVHHPLTQYRSVTPMQTIEQRGVSGDVVNGADSGRAEGASDA